MYIQNPEIGLVEIPRKIDGMPSASKIDLETMLDPKDVNPML
jgi:hypothetical protein